MKQILTAIIFLQLAYNSNAQSYIGISGGINSSGYSLSNSGGSFAYNHVIGISIGVPIEIYLSEKFNFSTGPKYISKGSTMIYLLIDNISYEPKIQVNYIELPFLLKWKFGNNKVKFNPIGGFSLGYGMSGYTEDLAEDNGNIFFMENEIDFGNDINRLLCQIHLGAGATFLLHKGALSFDIQYLKGINDLLTNSTLSDDYSLTANGFEFTAGYLFKIGKDKSKTTPVKK
jgi:Outer membrane protein beta-barrel domain